MLEGLEIRDIPLSECKKNKDYRIDTDYYINIPTKNPLYSYKKIGDCLIDSLYGISIDMNEEGKGYPIYRMNEIHNMLCDLEVGKYASISQETFKKFCLCDSDVLFNRTNSYEFVGRTSIYYNNDGSHRTFASYLVKLVPDSNILLPEYLTIYLNTKQGIKDIKRHARQSINQTNVNPEEVKDMEIPILSMSLQKELKDFLIKANKKRCNSFVLYKDAEKLLLKELGFEDWQQSTDNISVKTLKDSFCSSGRLDAEYYRPKYDDLFAKLSNVANEPISNIATIFKSVEPGSDAYQDSGIPFVRVSDITKYGITRPSIYLSPKEFNLEELKPRKDTILLSKDGTVGIAYKVESDSDYITSGALLHLSVFNEDFLPDYLTLVLNSIVVQMQAERDAGGSIIQHWKPSEINNVIIPKIPIEKQSELSLKIQESFALRHECERLLEVAKKAVEIAISENEETALEYIQQNNHS